MYTKDKAINELKKEIEVLRGHVLAYSNSDNKHENESFDAWVMCTFGVFENIVRVSLIDKGVEVGDFGVPNVKIADKIQYIPSVAYAIRYQQGAYPEQCIEGMKLLQNIRNNAVHFHMIDKKGLALFLENFKTMFSWFLLESYGLLIDYERLGVVEAFHSLERDITIAFFFENRQFILDNTSMALSN